MWRETKTRKKKKRKKLRKDNLKCSIRSFSAVRNQRTRKATRSCSVLLNKTNIRAPLKKKKNNNTFSKEKLTPLNN